MQIRSLKCQKGERRGRGIDFGLKGGDGNLSGVVAHGELLRQAIFFFFLIKGERAILRDRHNHQTRTHGNYSFFKLSFK